MDFQLYLSSRAVKIVIVVVVHNLTCVHIRGLPMKNSYHPCQGW